MLDMQHIEKIYQGEIVRSREPKKVITDDYLLKICVYAETHSTKDTARWFNISDAMVRSYKNTAKKRGLT